MCDTRTVENRTPPPTAFAGARRMCDTLQAADAIESSCALLTTAEGRATYGEAVSLIAAVLRGWSARRRGDPRWRSLLDMNSLLHEAEEAIVPLATLLRWLASADQPGDYTLADLCCGKGVFSLIVSHAAALQPRLRAIRRIVLIDRATRSMVDWTMVDDANADVSGDAVPGDAAGAGRAVVPLELWPGCNLHEEVETVEERLRSSPGQVLVLGIHLCRRLSPRAVSIYNRLGRVKAPLLLLAPCCLPRLSGGPIAVSCYETSEARDARLEATKRRAYVKRGRRMCWACLGEGHTAAECPVAAAAGVAADAASGIVRTTRPGGAGTAVADPPVTAIRAPCWRCGKPGHHKADCPAPAGDARPARELTMGPATMLDFGAVAAAKDKFGAWVSALLLSVEAADAEKEARHLPVDLPPAVPPPALATQHTKGGPADLPVEGEAPEGEGEEDEDEDKNWNRHRKCHWIVAMRGQAEDQWCAPRAGTFGDAPSVGGGGGGGGGVAVESVAGSLAAAAGEAVVVGLWLRLAPSPASPHSSLPRASNGASARC